MNLGGARAWVLLALLPLSALALRAACAVPRAAAPAPAAPAADAAATTLAWDGTLECADGSALRVRIQALHPAADRQAFDAAALRQRLALGPGEPFRCEIERTAATRGAAAPAPLFADLCVEDEAGTALALPDPPRALASPLVTLLRAPAEGLAPRSTLTLLLWGRAPGPGARCRFSAASEVALARAEVAVPDAESPLARVDARAAGAGTEER